MSENEQMLHQSDYLVKPDGSRVSLSGSAYHCPCCYAENSGTLRYHFGNFDLVSCRSCNILHLAPLPDAKALATLYNNNYFKDPMEMHGYRDYVEDSVAIRKTYHLRLRKAVQYVPSRIDIQNVHETGCALGIGLEVAAKLFRCTVSGSDISDEAVRTCRAKGFACYPSDSLGRCDLPVHPKVDLLYFFDVIEHLTDIPKFLAWADSVSSVHGILILATPDMDSLFNRVLQNRSPSIKIPQHIVYFSTRTLVQTLNLRFSLINRLSDWQYVTLGALYRRVLHVLGISVRDLYGTWVHTPVLVPNGMGLYVFQKK